MWVCWSCCSWRELLLCDTLRCRCRAAVHIGQHVAVRWQHVTAYQYYSAVSTSNCDASLHTAWSWTRCCVDQTTQYVLALCATWVCLSVCLEEGPVSTVHYSIVFCSNGVQWYEQFSQVSWLMSLSGFDLAWFSSVFRVHLDLQSSRCCCVYLNFYALCSVVCHQPSELTSFETVNFGGQ